MMIAHIALFAVLAMGQQATLLDFTYTDWRKACGNPLRWSDGHIEGPAGRVTAVSASGRSVTILVNGQRVRFRLAGMAVPVSSQSKTRIKRFLEEKLVGREVTTLLRWNDDRGRQVGVLNIALEDIALEMVLAGLVEHVHSDFLTAYENCLYRAAEEVAREERRGIWAD